MAASLAVFALAALALCANRRRTALVMACTALALPHAEHSRASRQSPDCSRMVTPLNYSPSRSPQAVHTFLLPHFAGKDLAEIGTHAGDGMACFASVARSATAIEVEAHSCVLLRERALSLALRGERSLEVECDTYKNVLPDADAYTWWRESPLTNEGILAELHARQRQGRIRADAVAYPLFDHKWDSDMRSWAALQDFAAWHHNVSFDECAESRWENLGWLGRLRRLVGYVLFPSTRDYYMRGGRCRGMFTVAAFRVSELAGLTLGAFKATAPPPHATLAARLASRHRHPQSGGGGVQRDISAPSCIVHRGAILFDGHLYNMSRAADAGTKDLGPPGTRRVEGGVHRLSLTSPYFGSALLGATVSPLQPLPRPCEYVARGVLASAAGGYGCAQLAHFLFNFLLPQWDAMEQIGWLDGALSQDRQHPSQHQLFLDCGGHYHTGMRVESAPSFVREALPVLAAARVRDLGLGESKMGLLNSRRRPICFGELLVGSACASLDEYNPALALPLEVTRVGVWRLRLMALTLGRSVGALSWLAHSRPVGSDAIVLLTDRRGGRRWLNVATCRHAAAGIRGVREASVIYWEGLALKEQMLASM